MRLSAHEFVEEARLADAEFPDNGHELAVPRVNTFERPGQLSHLVGAPDEWR